MSDVKFTKGPWVCGPWVSGRGFDISQVDANGDYGDPVCSGGMSESDASLIAAAPEIYAMLEDFVSDHGYVSYISDEEKENDAAVIEARKLLAKARGEL